MLLLTNHIMMTIGKKTAMSAAEAGLKQAEDAATAVLGPRAGVDSSDEDSDDGVRLRHRLAPTTSSSASGVKEDDIRGLESAAKRAKTAGSTLPQVCVVCVVLIASTALTR